MTLDQPIGFIIGCTDRVFVNYLAVRLKPHNITPEQWGLLRQVGERAGITQKVLACSVKKDQTNVTRILDQLEKKGFVRREMKKGDRRSFQLFLTEEGELLRNTLMPVIGEILTRALHGLFEAEVTLLKRLLLQIMENLSVQPNLSNPDE